MTRAKPFSTTAIRRIISALHALTGKAAKQTRFFAKPVAIIALVFLLTAGASRAADSSTNADSMATALQTAHFAEPLVATAPTSSVEDQALVQALTSYARRAQPDDFGNIAAFLAKYPHSGWAPALLTNLGISYLHDGYFSRAIDAWRKAWAQGKSATDPRAKALVDRAVGELAWLYAALGQTKNLSELLAEIGHRPISGSATESVQAASEDLALVKKNPRHLFNCGPVALSSLMLALGADFGQVKFLQFYRAGPNGTSLAEVAKLADEAKFPYRLVFRKPGQPVPVPAIVHWKLGHFAAIVGEANGHYHVRDPEFPGSGLWVTPAALDSEASGYFLVPTAASHSAGWRSVSIAEAGRVWGKGATSSTRAGDAGDSNADGAGNGSASSGSNGGGPNVPNGGNNGNNNGNCGGMCGYNIKESSVSVTLSDTPVGYAPPIGPSAKVQITYNQREDSQPANFNFFNVSPKWTLNWLSYVTDDPHNPGANVSRYMAGGGAFYYTGYNSATGQFAAQDTDGSILVLASQTPITYQRQLSDGSVEIYAQSNGSASYPRSIFLSEVIDPQGNTLTLNYDNQERLVSLTDATGRQTTFTYGISVRPLLVTQLTDPFGRSANLAYDSSGRLISITDVIGLTSSFTYDANSLVNSMTTPMARQIFRIRRRARARPRASFRSPIRLAIANAKSG